MSNTPAFPPPQNPNDLGRGPMVMGLTWTFTGLAVITTLLRFYVRKRIGPRPAMDDWLMLAAMIFQLIAQIFVTIAFKYGLGKHQYDLYIPDELVPMSMWEWFSVPPGLVSGMFGRISICILLIRLFGVHVWFKYYAIVVTGCGVIMSMIICISLFASRQPAASLWDPFIPVTSRWNSNVVQDMMFLGQSLYALADLTFVIIPIIIIWNLHMNFNRRLGLIALMALSLFTCGMSIMKGVSAIDGTSGADATYTGTLSLLWATLEQACVVLLGNVAPLRPIVKIQIPIISTMAESVGTLLGRSSKGSSSKAASSGTPGYPNGVYHDIELNTHKLGGRSNEVWHEVKGNGSPYDTNAGSTIDEGQVRRTDAFTVVYAQSDSSPRPS